MRFYIKTLVNSFRPSDTYMRQQPKSSLIRIMTYRCSVSRYYLSQSWHTVNRTTVKKMSSAKVWRPLCLGLHVLMCYSTTRHVKIPANNLRKISHYVKTALKRRFDAILSLLLSYKLVNRAEAWNADERVILLRFSMHLNGTCVPEHARTHA